MMECQDAGTTRDREVVPDDGTAWSLATLLVALSNARHSYTLLTLKVVMRHILIFAHALCYRGNLLAISIPYVLYYPLPTKSIGQYKLQY